MKKPLLAMFVVAAIAIGLLIVLAIGVLNVDEDGREQGSARSGATGDTTGDTTGAGLAGYRFS